MDKTENYTNNNLPTILTGMVLVVFSTFLVFLLYFSKDKLESNRPIFSTFWKPSNLTKVQNGPSWLYFDFNSRKIISLKRITELEKIQLINLVDINSPQFNGYKNAIEKLVYNSNTTKSNYFNWSILLMCVCGMIGVQLRTLNNFIGITCFKKDFEFHIWWPWYLIRPIIGGMIGIIILILIDGDLYKPINEINSSESLKISLAIIAGFGSEDFLELLRRMSKRFFGVSNNEPTKIENKK